LRKWKIKKEISDNLIKNLQAENISFQNNLEKANSENADDICNLQVEMKTIRKENNDKETAIENLEKEKEHATTKLEQAEQENAILAKQLEETKVDKEE
jgi:hypothetical protein